ncbi:MAG: HAD-IA family hydrolase [Candidatus Aureabacteria bacterium]|nr:HAD-IA family hydrolase [Candidatus Auribacterota bacterium]
MNAVLFDMDGTLIDSKKTISRHFITALDEMGVPHSLDLESLGDQLEIPFIELNHRLGLNLDKKKINEFISLYRKNYLLDPVNGTKIYEGVEEVLCYIKTRRIKIVLVTGKRNDAARLILEKLGLTDYFDWIQGEEEGLKAKPEPDILKHALYHIHIPAQDCIMVGDTHVDILAGKSLGMKTVAALYGLGKKATLEKTHPDFWIKTIRDLIKIMEDKS